jgi:SAM-dependent methyltransferase
MSETIALADLDSLKNALRNGLHEEWMKFHGRCLALPGWYDESLDPMSPGYSAQQFRLWEMFGDAAGSYDAKRDEQFDDYDEAIVIASPGFYRARSPGAVFNAGDHLVAMGHLLKCSRLVAGDWALEYGAGYGQIALTLARLGVNVDTVDINQLYNKAVQAQADHFRVPLTSFHGVFGDNPRGAGHAYDLILFYESFHHCAEFLQLPRRLRGLLKPNGRVLMAGEPIGNGNPSVPYPWGVRLDAEAVAVSGVRRWLELGFSEDFLVSLFHHHGFVWRRHDCPISHYGIVHEFTLRPAHIELAKHRMPEAEDTTWHFCEPNGRWTQARSVMSIEDMETPATVLVSVHSHNPVPVEVTFRGQHGERTEAFRQGESKLVALASSMLGGSLEITSPTFVAGGADQRQLGVFVTSLDYA